jgi:ceramide glucosyltransferase
LDWFIYLILVIDVTLFCIFLYGGIKSHIYPWYYKKKFPNTDSWPGTVSVFIPCKGVYPAFQSKIEKILNVIDDYIRVFFIVESKEDPAFPVIGKTIEDNPRAHVVVAGTATQCGQKNYNILKGIEASGKKDDFYLFLDADTCFTSKELKTLLGPFADPSYDCTYGFQWNILKKKNFGDRLMSFMIGSEWLNLNLSLMKWVWGGAFALRRTTYEKLEIHAYWSTRVVDDISLVPLLKKHKARICFVPTVINEQHQGVTSIKQALLWYKRQFLYLKLYTYPIWLLGIVSFTFYFGRLWVLPLLIVGAALFQPTLVLPFVVYTFFTICIVIINTGLMKRPSKDNFSTPAWLALCPIFSAFLIIPILMTLFTWKLAWAKVIYKLNRKGIVVNIERK